MPQPPKRWHRNAGGVNLGGKTNHHCFGIGFSLHERGGAAAPRLASARLRPCWQDSPQVYACTPHGSALRACGQGYATLERLPKRHLWAKKTTPVGTKMGKTNNTERLERYRTNGGSALVHGGWLFRGYCPCLSPIRILIRFAVLRHGCATTSRLTPNHLLPLTEQKGVSGCHRDNLITFLFCAKARETAMMKVLNS